MALGVEEFGCNSDVQEGLQAQRSTPAATASCTALAEVCLAPQAAHTAGLDTTR